MKITKTRLKQIIQEEWQLTMEGPPPGSPATLPPPPVMGKKYKGPHGRSSEWTPGVGYPEAKERAAQRRRKRRRGKPVAAAVPPSSKTSLPREPDAAALLKGTKHLVNKINYAIKDKGYTVVPRLSPARGGYKGILKFSHPTFPITVDMFNNKVWNDSQFLDSLTQWEEETGVEIVTGNPSIKKGDERTYGDTLIMPVWFGEADD